MSIHELGIAQLANTGAVQRGKNVAAVVVIEIMLIDASLAHKMCICGLTMRYRLSNTALQPQPKKKPFIKASEIDVFHLNISQCTTHRHRTAIVITAKCYNNEN